jgi:hypothetical protein
MRTVTITKHLFKFDELNEEAKENARKLYRESMYNDFTIETMMITENMEHTLNIEGFESDKNGIEWDLSNSQSDYVGLKGKIETKKLHQMIMDKLDNREKKWYKTLAVDSNYIDVGHNVSYHHYYGQQTSIEVYLNLHESSYPVIFTLYQKIETIAEELVKDEVDRLTRLLKKQGYKEIEWFFSDEHIDDVLTVNEYEFEEGGNHYL